MGQPDPSLALHLAICTPSYFNNENDEVLRKWNQLQAFWGAGKGTHFSWRPQVGFRFGRRGEMLGVEVWRGKRREKVVEIIGKLELN